MVDTQIVLHALHVGNVGGTIDLAEWSSGIQSLGDSDPV